MKRRETILISAAGGSFFPYVIQLLQPKYNLILTDTLEVTKKIYPDQKVVIVPRADDRRFSQMAREIINRFKVDFYLPLIDKEIPKVLWLVRDIPSLKVISPNLKFVRMCIDKYRLMKILSQKQISWVNTELATDINRRSRFPVFIKPIMSTGSRGARKLINFDQFEAYFKLDNYRKTEAMVQEYLEGDEYTVSVVVNNLNQLLAIVPKKIIVKKGITQQAVTKRNSAIDSTCRQLVDTLKPHGPINVQLMLVGSQVKIFEINPRFSTTTILTCEAGVNEFELCIDNYNHQAVKYINTWREGLHIYRRWESCFYEG